MIHLRKLTKGLLGASALSFMYAGTAFAGGTAAGTSVQNTFTLDYQVGSVDQPQINTGPSGSNTPTLFTVDRLIDLTVASNGDNSVAPGALNQELVFSITNNGNDTQAYSLVLVSETGDTFNSTNLGITYYVDDGDGIFETDGSDGAGTGYTVGSGAASADLPADAILWVVVDSDIPASQNDADTAQISLVADTLQPSTGGSPGTAVTPDTGGNTLTGAAENVLADGAGTSNEVAGAGDHSATGTYIVASADMTGSKAVTIFSEDGTGCSTIPGTAASGDQYSIPGACVEYVITVVNGGATASATSVAISDTLPAELEFIAAAKSGFTGGTLSVPSANTSCVGSACVVGLSGATLPAGTTGKLTIRALVQ